MHHNVVLVVSALIVDERNRMLMVREAQPEFYGLWNQPAGHVEAGESLEDAFVREVKEESVNKPSRCLEGLESSR